MRRGLRDFAKRHWMRRAGVEPDADADLFVPPPDAEAVARRAAIIGSVVIRGVTEHEERVADFDYFDDLGLARDAEPEELVAIRAPHGALPEQATINAHWRAEALAVLSEGDTST